MNNKEYNLLKKQIESHYREAVAKAEAERIANLAALDRVWKLMQEIQPVAETLDRKVASPKRPTPVAQNADAVYDCKGCGNTTEYLPEVCEKCSWGSFEQRKNRIFKLTA